MKFPYLYYLLVAIVILSCSTNQEDAEQGELQQAWELEIIDSVMVDHIGLMMFTDISPDGSKYLGYDNKSFDFIITDSEGNIISQFNKSGDRPDGLGTSMIARPKFINDHQFAVSSSKGVFIYNLDGQLEKLIAPNYEVQLNVNFVGADHLHLIEENHVVTRLEGRARGDGRTVEDLAGPRLELVDLERNDFKGIVKMPSKSRLADGNIFPLVNTMPFFTVSGNSLFLFFKNDDQFYVYNMNDLDKPEEAYKLPLENFQLVPGKDPLKVDNKEFRFDLRDIFYGGIENILALGDKLIVVYTSGLSDQEYKSTTDGVDDPNEIFEVVERVNKKKVILMSEDGNPFKLNYPENINAFQFQDKNGNIYLDLKSEQEKDYEVIYIARLKSLN